MGYLTSAKQASIPQSEELSANGTVLRTEQTGCLPVTVVLRVVICAFTHMGSAPACSCIWKLLKLKAFGQEPLPHSTVRRLRRIPTHSPQFLETEHRRLKTENSKYVISIYIKLDIKHLTLTLSSPRHQPVPKSRLSNT